MTKFIGQRLLGSTGDWYDIPAEGHDRSDDPRRVEFESKNLAEDNAVRRATRGDFGVVPKIRIVEVLSVRTIERQS